MTRPSSSRIDRGLLNLAVASAFEELSAAGAFGLAEVLCAAHAAFVVGNEPEQRKRLLKAARSVLQGHLHQDTTGARQYVKGYRPVPLGVGPTALDRARYIRGRVELSLSSGQDVRQVAREVAAAVQFAWPVVHPDALKISNDERVMNAIVGGQAETVVKASLRAAGVKVSRNLFSADDQKQRRGKL